MSNNNTGIHVFLGLILAVACFAVGRLTAGEIEITHTISLPTIGGEQGTPGLSHGRKQESGFVIKLIKAP